MPIRTIAGATGFSRPLDDALRERRQEFLSRLEALDSQLDGSTLEAALALMITEYRAAALARRQAMALASSPSADPVDVGLLSDLDELTARIDLVATVRERIGPRDSGDAND